MGMDLVAADEHLAPEVLVTVAEFAAAALAGGWYLLQYNPASQTGRVVSMPPGPDRVGVLVRGGADGAVIEMARTWMITDPTIAWTPSSEQISQTVRRCLETGLPGQATALRVLTGDRAVRYRVELNLHPDVAGPTYSALFERTE